MNGGITITEDQSIKLTRTQLYNEIWEISVTGVAKKFNVHYTELLKLCKEKDIPIPPSGYWTKLSFGKPVTQTPLPESPINEVTLPANYTPKRSKRSAASDAATKVMVGTQQEEDSDIVVKTAEQTEVSEKHSVDEVPDVPQDDQLTYHAVSGEGNTYNRQKLYEEVWTKPVVDVAVQYGVSDVAIHKVCKSLNVPVPPRGYWARLRAGEKLKRPSLPATDGIIEKTGARTFDGIKEAGAKPRLLGFLTESERLAMGRAAEDWSEFMIVAVSKEKFPDKAVINLTDPTRLAAELAAVQANMPRILALKAGLEEPIRCENCNYCRSTKVLNKVIQYAEV